MKWTVSRLEPGDREVFDDEFAVEEPDPEPSNSHRPADTLRTLAFRETAQTRAQIDRQRRHDGHGEDHRKRDDAKLGDAEREMRPNALEPFESQRHFESLIPIPTVHAAS